MRIYLSRKRYNKEETKMKAEEIGFIQLAMMEEIGELKLTVHGKE